MWDSQFRCDLRRLLLVGVVGSLQFGGCGAGLDVSAFETGADSLLAGEGD